ncbi:oxidoreductase [Rhodospirillales bacterium]|nr:oxidoreductase [Rhodospirillales bacterium]
MKKWNLIVDVGRCHNSNNCFLSVADEYQRNEHPGYSAEMPLHGHRWIDVKKKERGQAPMVDVAYLPTMCMHCDDAPCIAAAKDDAIQKRNDGIVIIDPVKAKGQKHLVDSCPYGAIWWNEEKQLPQHWNFDAHLLDSGWVEPRCVQSCPTGALRSVIITDSEMERLKSEEGLEQLEPEIQTKPRVHYKNLHLYKKCFIGGTVVITDSGLEDCLEGAIAVLNKDEKKIGEEISDAFGEFKFDDLEPASGAYRIDILHPEYTSLSVNVELRESIYTGVHALTPR